MRVITLGTGGTIPTRERNLPAVAIQREGELFLFDCGEGTQLQIIKAGLGLGKLRAIFISHLHGDHITGLPGLLMTLMQFYRQDPLFIFGPDGIIKYINMFQECLGFEADYEVIVKEIDGGKIWQGRDYWIEAFPISHNILTLAYFLQEEERPGKFMVEKALSLGVPQGPLFSRLQNGRDVILSNGKVVRPRDVLGEPRKGRKVVYAVDTRPCEEVVRLGSQADVLIHDAMFSDEMREEAEAKGHSTVVQAAEVAQKAKVEKLVLTHISPRYSQDDALLAEAVAVFPHTVVAKDSMEFEILVHK